jgi:divalent metal cation (Fe/Co/Zn/Cd) transporter
MFYYTGVVVFACIMSVSMMSLVQTSVETTIRTLAITNTSLIPSMAFEPIGVSILSATIGIKCLLSIFCYWVGKKGATINPSVIAYADDHRNDVFTNSLAMLMWGIATIDPSRLWFTDPLGAVLICLYVIVNWQQTASEQIANLVSSNCVKVTIRKTHHCVASCVVYYKCFFSSR